MTGGDRKNADSALILAIAAGATIRDAAVSAGVSESTAHRRLDDPAFTRQVDDARAEMIARAAGQLADASTEAVATLRALLDAEAETVRLGSARAILELGTKLRESEELGRRIAALEAQQAEPGPESQRPRLWPA